MFPHEARLASNSQWGALAGPRCRPVDTWVVYSSLLAPPPSTWSWPALSLEANMVRSVGDVPIGRGTGIAPCNGWRLLLGPTPWSRSSSYTHQCGFDAHALGCLEGQHEVPFLKEEWDSYSVRTR